MSKTTNLGLTRRHLLQLAGFGSAALALPTTAVGAPGRACGPPPATTPRALYALVSSLIGYTADAVKRRLAFDRGASSFIGGKLSESQWKTFVEMNPGAIRGAVVKELTGLDDIKDTFTTNFDEFVKDWPGHCDGYDEYPWCPKENHGGANCPPTPRPPSQKDRVAEQDVRYALPRSHLKSVQPVGTAGDYEIRGEGLLECAVANVWKDGETPTEYAGTLGGTFRCSTLTFRPIGSGTYNVFVVNKYGNATVSIKDDKNQPLQFTI